MWKPDLNWFAEYVGGIVLGQLGGLTIDQAHALGRNTADWSFNARNSGISGCI